MWVRNKHTKLGRRAAHHGRTGGAAASATKGRGGSRVKQCARGVAAEGECGVFNTGLLGGGGQLATLHSWGSRRSRLARAASSAAGLPSWLSMTALNCSASNSSSSAAAGRSTHDSTQVSTRSHKKLGIRPTTSQQLLVQLATNDCSVADRHASLDPSRD